jgi:hypothetical protein
MIAPLYNNALDGDVQMRQQWYVHTFMYICIHLYAIINVYIICVHILMILNTYRLTITNRAIKPNPKAATDLGCGTGLSMYMLDSKWPSIEKVTGTI